MRSVANLTRRDGEEFLAWHRRCRSRTTTVEFPLTEASTALDRLRNGEIEGAAVLVP